MVVVDGEGLPLASHLDSASRAEFKLLEPTLDAINVTPTPSPSGGPSG